MLGIEFYNFYIEIAIDVDVDIFLIAYKYCDKYYSNTHTNIESNKSK